jgi:cytochrome b561
MAARPRRYPLSLSVLHWVMAFVVLAQVGLGFQIADNPDAWTNGAAYAHAQMGIVIFLTAVLRIVIRLTRPMPSQPGGWGGLMWKLEYWALYGLMILLPLTGLAAWGAETKGAMVPVFGLFEIPPPPEWGLHRPLGVLAVALGWLHIYMAAMRFLTVGPPYFNRIIPSLAPEAPRESA